MTSEKIEESEVEEARKKIDEMVSVRSDCISHTVESPPDAEWEVLASQNEEERDYNSGFINEIRELDGNRCQISGDEGVHVCHLSHRGKGGDDTKNHPDLCICLSPKWHDRLDGREKPEIKITRWNRNDPENGLEVWINTDYGWVVMDKEKLWFYSKPTEEKGKRFDEIRSEIKELAKVYKQSWWLIVERLKEIRDDHLYVSAGYPSFAAALADEFNLFPEIDWKYKGSWLSKNFGALELSKTLDTETGKKLLMSGVEKAYQISTIDNPNVRASLVADVIQNSATEKDIRRRVKEYKHGVTLPEKSCIQCAKSFPQGGSITPDGEYFNTDGGKLPLKFLKIHDRPLFICPLYGHIVTTMSKERAAEVAIKCKDFEQR